MNDLEPRFRTALLSVFAVTALALAAIGVYGLISYSVAQRTREIGIRLALGARGADIVRLMLTRIGLSVLAGSVMGLLVAVWLSRYVAPLLYGLGARDPITLVVAAATLAAVAVLAAWRPVSRAVRVYPALVLR